MQSRKRRICKGMILTILQYALQKRNYNLLTMNADPEWVKYESKIGEANNPG